MTAAIVVTAVGVLVVLGIICAAIFIFSHLRGR